MSARIVCCPRVLRTETPNSFLGGLISTTISPRQSQDLPTPQRETCSPDRIPVLLSIPCSPREIIVLGSCRETLVDAREAKSVRSACPGKPEAHSTVLLRKNRKGWMWRFGCITGFWTQRMLECSIEGASVSGCVLGSPSATVREDP